MTDQPYDELDDDAPDDELDTTQAQFDLMWAHGIPVDTEVGKHTSATPAKVVWRKYPWGSVPG